jgi:hypothetical protein
MTYKLHPEGVIKILVVFYLFSIFTKAYLGLSITLLLDLFLVMVLFVVVNRGIASSDLKRLAAIFISGMLLLVRLNHGLTVDSLLLMLTSRMPLMVFITVFLSMYYMRTQLDLDRIGRFIEKMIAILIIFIVVDGVYINYIGSAYDLILLFQPVGYNYIANSPWFNFVAQGLVPNAQHASIISCAGIILFFQLEKFTFKRTLLFLLSIFSLMLSITSTALASLLIAIFVGYFVTFRLSYKPILMGIFLLIFSVLIAYSFIDWLTFRYDKLANVNESVVLAFIERNIEIYISPLANMQRFPFYVLLIGVGHSSVATLAALLAKEYSLVGHHADFGYLYMLFEHGIINTLMLASLYIGFVLYVKRNLKYVLENKKRVYIVKLVIIVSLFVVSGVHYMTPTKGGLLQIIILMASIAIISIQKNRRRLNPTTNVKNNT